MFGFIIYPLFVYYTCISIGFLATQQVICLGGGRDGSFFSALPDLLFRSGSQKGKKKYKQQTTATSRKRHITIKEATTLKGDF